MNKSGFTTPQIIIFFLALAVVVGGRVFNFEPGNHNPG